MRAAATQSDNVSDSTSGTSPNATSTVASPRNGRERLRNCVAGAQLLRLLDPSQISRIGKRGANLCAGVTDDDMNALRIERAGGAKDVAEQRTPGEVVQHFGQLRAHPRALTRREHDDFEAHGVGVHSGIRGIIEAHIKKGVTMVTPFIVTM